MAADSDDCAAIELTPTRTEAIDWLCACLAADDGPPTRSTWALQSQYTHAAVGHYRAAGPCRLAKDGLLYTW